jgi:hypothetical protein
MAVGTYGDAIACVATMWSLPTPTDPQFGLALVSCASGAFRAAVDTGAGTGVTAAIYDGKGVGFVWQARCSQVHPILALIELANQRKDNEAIDCW